jgi:uncharacterized SAM-binding protein YcdF (DUF218 family)
VLRHNRRALNDLLLALGAENVKPVLTALLLPPVPWLALVVLGALLLRTRRAPGGLLIAASLAGLWFGSTVAVAEWLQRAVLAPPAALGATDIARIKRDVAAGKPVVVLVLGGGREPMAPEYGAPNLPPLALERLRYGAWLAKATGAPLAFAGGVGHAQGAAGPSEAEVAARIAQAEFGVPLRWRESESRDTRENAARALVLLREAGVREVLLVTHGWHMPRAQRAFAQAARDALRIVPAPMGLAPSAMLPALRWMPSEEGFRLTHRVWRERLGLWLGA